MNKREAKIEALYIVGNSAILLMDGLELNEDEHEIITKAVDEICQKLLNRHYLLKDKIK